jgi:hypothetical protein
MRTTFKLQALNIAAALALLSSQAVAGPSRPNPSCTQKECAYYLEKLEDKYKSAHKRELEKLENQYENAWQVAESKNQRLIKSLEDQIAQLKRDNDSLKKNLDGRPDYHLKSVPSEDKQPNNANDEAAKKAKE